MQILTMPFTHYFPIATGLFALFFFIVLFRQWLKNREAIHLLWWVVGVGLYSLTNIAETINTFGGFVPINYKIWYISGVLFGGATLAQGVVHSVMKHKTADILSYFLVLVIITTSLLVLRSPLKPGAHETFTGGILEWEYIRYITPFINTYALIFLVGGALYAAIKYARTKKDKGGMWGNILIAIGGLLPGIGGIYAKAGIIEIRYITEFLGICIIYMGYHIISAPFRAHAHNKQPFQELNLTK